MGQPNTAVRVVRSVEEEDELMGQCECGGPWALTAEAVAPEGRRWMDSLRVACHGCGRHRAYKFDVSAFFVPRPNVCWR